MESKHSSYDLAQMQSLPLDMKIRMSKERIKNWYEQWRKYTIVNTKTKKERFVTWYEEPNDKGCFIKKTKKIDGKMVEVNVFVKGTKLKPTEYVKSEEDGQVYIGFSGGKDSTVLKHLVHSMYLDVPDVFVNTGLEYDSVRKKGISEAKEIVRPKKSPLQVISDYGYPVISKEVAQAIYECQKAKMSGKEMPKYRIEKLEGAKLTEDGKKSAYNMKKYNFLLDAPFRISHLCCNISKKQPSKEYEHKTGRKPILGTMAEESRLRKSKWIKYGCNGFESNRPTSQPLSFWTEQDILEYIKYYMQPELDNAWDIVTHKIKYNRHERKMAKKLIKSYGYSKSVIADAYGEIISEEENEIINANDFKQLTIFDYIGKDCSECKNEINKSKLTTTKAKRTGCIYCLFGITQDLDRFVKLKEEEPVKYDYVMRGGCFDKDGYWKPGKDENGVFGLGYKFVIDWLNEHGNLGIRY